MAVSVAFVREWSSVTTGSVGVSPNPPPMTKSWHRKPENVRRYFHPLAEAIAEVTSLLAPGDRHR